MYRYVAAPHQSSSTRKSGSSWTKINQKIDDLKSTNEKLKASNQYHKQLSAEQYTHISHLNKRLLAVDIPEDRPSEVDDVEQPIHIPRPYNDDDIKAFVRSVTKGYGASDEQLSNLFLGLGLDNDGKPNRNLSKAVRKKKLVTGIQTLLDVHFGGYTEAEQADIFGELSFNHEIFSADVTRALGVKVSRSVTAQLFNAVRILQLIDSTASSLNDRGADDIASLERSAVADGVIPKTKRGHTMLSHRHKITNVRNLANRFTNHIFTVKHTHDSEWGDLATVNLPKAFRFMLDHFGLTDTAQTNGVEFAVSADGVRICNFTSVNQCLGGFKATSKESKSPRDGKPLCEYVKDEDDRDRLCSTRFQSTDNCIVTHAVAQGESKDVMRNCFGELFAFCREIEKNGLAADGDQPAIAPCNPVCCADMSCEQKVTNGGGPCKVATFFCHYCACRSDAKSLFRYVEAGDRCELCQYNGRDRCSHTPVNTSDEIKSKARELLDLLETDARAKDESFCHLRDLQPRGPTPGIRYDGVSRVWEPVLLRSTYKEEVEDGSPWSLKSAYNEDGSPSRAHLYDYARYIKHTEEDPKLLAESRIRLDQNAVDKDDDANNIAYQVLPHKIQNNNTFNKNVLHDLKLRYPITQIPSDRAQRIAMLRGCLLMRQRVNYLRDSLEEYDRAIEHRLLDPGKCIPCVLHFNVRVVEKLTQQLLLCGMRQNLSPKELSEFVRKVEEVVNRDMLGRKDYKHDPAWRFPLTEDKKQLGDVKLSNNRARDFAKGFSHLVEVCTDGYDDFMRTTWMDACTRFRKVTEMVDSRYEFEFEDVAEFQLAADEFCDAYFTVTGRDGMTNYTHCLKAGHFSWFLLEYGNLYRYSQQGWENVNSRFKRKFFSNTQRGGGRGTVRSKLLPVFYSFLREMLWRNGMLGGYFEHLGRDGKVNIEYGKVTKIPNNKRVTDEEVEVYANTIFKFAPREEVDELIGAVEGGLDIIDEGEEGMLV